MIGEVAGTGRRGPGLGENAHAAPKTEPAPNACLFLCLPKMPACPFPSCPPARNDHCQPQAYPP